MTTQFDPFLVILSVLVAIFASYVALNIANNLTRAKGRVQQLWLALGAVTMGTGIWSMHFVGMLAFEMPGMAMAYDIPLAILSIVVAIGASALAFSIISRPVIGTNSIIAGGIAMAAAISGMHYIGMYSMRMEASIHWNLFLVVLSVVIALVASFGALLILMRLRTQIEHQWHLFFASGLMGLAIAGMHYTGMLAATFVHHEHAEIGSDNLLVSSGLVIAVVAVTLLLLGLALATSMGQRLWEKQNIKADQKLGQSEEKFRHLVNAVKDYAIFMLDTEGRITTWNSGAERITGYSESEIIGKHVSIFYTEEDVNNETARKELVAAEETGHFECEGMRKRKDGSIYWASIVLTPLFKDGKLTGFSKVTRDITQFKESERLLRQMNEELEERVRVRTLAIERHENQLRTITNAVPILLAQVDRNEKFLFANEAFCTWFRRPNGGVIGKNFRDILGEHRYPANESFIKRALAGETVTYERNSRSGDFSAILSITFVPEPSGFIVVASDITKHKEVQEELKKAKEAAEVANETKSAFLANMSHEIRTPLGAVLGFSELLLNDEMSASERHNSVEVIKRNGHLLSNIINDILDLSKVEAGKMEVEKVDVPFHEIMKEISASLGLSASEKGLELKVTSEGMVPSKVKTDPLRLKQILINIIGNAIKFTSQGSVNVKVKAVQGQESTKLAFVISDTGVGIRPEQVERLFTPFMQADVSTTRKYGGTGLGLVLSKKLAQALGGDIVLTETHPNRGSTFTVTIDAGLSEQVIFQSSTAHQATTTRLADLHKKFDLSNLKILVVDDSGDNQALIKKILKTAGAAVETANNGEEGVNKAINGNYSFVLMDLQMPVMDGYEATKILRENGYKKPIIALTAHAMKEERQRSLRSGFNDHITKPIDQESLVRTLAEYQS